MKPNCQSSAGHRIAVRMPEENWKERPHRIISFFGAIAILLLLTSTYCAFKIWKTDTKLNVSVYPNKGEKTLKIVIEGNIEVTSDQDEDKRESPTCGVTKDDDKFDCYPEPGSTEAGCLARGCCWNVQELSSTTENPLEENVPNTTENPLEEELLNSTGNHWGDAQEELVYSVGVPDCYYPPNYSGYEVVSSEETRQGLQARLKRVYPSGFPKDIQEVLVTVSFMDEDKVNIKITDPNAVRYEVPFPKLRGVYRGRRHGLYPKYKVIIKKDGTLLVIRRETGTKIFNANLATMVFADQLLQLNVKVPYRGLYGLGETKDSLFRGHDWKRYVFFNHDGTPIANRNLYGSHPFYLQMEKKTHAHGVFLFNSNAMDIVTQPSPAVTFRPIGGILDFYIFMGPSPSEVVKQYVELIGHPFMPPYWSLGFHLCRYGYGSLNNTREVWQRNRDTGIPFDVQWNDIDYMEHYNDFTVDPINFEGLGDFVDELHDKGMHYVVIMDVGVGGPDLAGGYPPYDDGVEMDVLMKDNTGDILIAKVWNTGSTVFPDFTHPRAGEYMTKQYQNLHDIVKIDGAWTDMNEPSNFVEGSVDGCPEDNPLESPPYVPGSLEPLRSKTACMSAQQHASTHYNVHNIHGFTNVIATNIALKNVRHRRPFIISRSTFPGTGHYGGHWNGDIRATWDYLQNSIASALTFGIFGIPMTGSDICGFSGATTEELCARWQELGAFYPFSRNHNDKGYPDQDPAIMGPVVLKATRDSLLIRYRLLPFLYTLFYRSHVYGETVARPLFFEFSDDPLTYAIDSTFLWGKSLMIIPVLTEGDVNVTAYIPEDTWYDYHTGKKIEGAGDQVSFDAPIGKINILVRGGNILPTQKPATTTTDSRKNKFGLLVALQNGGAKGELYWDDGDSLDTYHKKNFNLIKFSAYDNKLRPTVLRYGYKSEMTLGEVQILGCPSVTNVTLNGQDFSSFTYDEQSQVLLITTLKQSLLEAFVIEWH